MSGETTQQGSTDGAQGTLPGVLGAPAVKNGAEGAQTPAPTTTVSAQAETKPGETSEAKPAEKTPEQLANEKKAADEAAATKKAADEKAAKEATDKEWSEYKPTRAEGIQADEATMKDALAGLREAGLTTKQAQAVIALSDKLSLAGAEAAKKAQAAAVEKFYADQRAESLKTTAAKFGNDKAKLEEASVHANKAFEKFVDASALNELRALNWDVHPAIFEAFHKVGLALKDDSVAGSIGAGGARAPSEKEFLDQMYPSMRKS